MESEKGFVEHIVYQNAENGYTVLSLSIADDEITVVGTFPKLTEGESICVEGEYVTHPVYGKQFKASSYKVVPPDDEEAMFRFLKSGAVKGVGAALAERIIKEFGKDTFRIIEDEPERLAVIKGISERKAREIASSLEERREFRDVSVFLAGYGISSTMSLKIFEKYGTGIYLLLKENPYKLAEDIAGIGFKTADEIATKIGIRVDSEFRIRSGILYTLSTAMADGHMYLPRTELIKQTVELLGVDEDSIDTLIDNLAMERKVVVKENREKVYAANNYYTELDCARRLCEISEFSHGDTLPDAYDEDKLRDRIRKIAKREDISLDELQEEAVVKSASEGVLILSGGPGTGKTTTINTMIHFFLSEGLEIALAAPTGRAAKRMSEATGYEAKTIHRLLELNGNMDEESSAHAHFERNEENPLETDVIIIDEMSMVDILLFRALLRAIVPGTRLIMVGDVNQLPSVGPGQVLRDILESGRFPTVVLKKIFRQAMQSDIITNAHKIHAGEEIELGTKSKDFFFLERNDTNVIYKHLVQLIRDKLPGYVDATPLDIQVLTPMRKGALGVETLNKILQEYLNPPAASKKEHIFGDTVFRVGDKVMQVKNNYQLEWEVIGKFGIAIDKGQGVFNGDMGRIVEIDENASQITVVFDEIRTVVYPFSLLEELELSYAITIHKAQGSEYPAVLIPILTGPRMLLNRNLFYTAVTRAKKCVTILGSADTIRSMIANESENLRYSDLKKRIEEIFCGE